MDEAVADRSTWHQAVLHDIALFESIVFHVVTNNGENVASRRVASNISRCLQAILNNGPTRYVGSAQYWGRAFNHTDNDCHKIYVEYTGQEAIAIGGKLHLEIMTLPFKAVQSVETALRSTHGSRLFYITFTIPKPS